MPTNRTTTGFEVVCTPSVAAYELMSVKTDAAANGGVVIASDYQFTIQVLGVSGTWGTGVPMALSAYDYVRGENVALAGGAYGWGNDTLLNAPPYDAVANAAEWDFNLKTAGRYQLFANYAMHVSRPVDISFNGTVELANALAASTGGQYPANRQLLLQGTVQLPAGKNTMRVARSNVFPHISFFLLMPVD